MVSIISICDSHCSKQLSHSSLQLLKWYNLIVIFFIVANTSPQNPKKLIRLRQMRAAREPCNNPPTRRRARDVNGVENRVKPKSKKPKSEKAAKVSNVWPLYFCFSHNFTLANAPQTTCLLNCGSPPRMIVLTQSTILFSRRNYIVINDMFLFL